MSRRIKLVVCSCPDATWFGSGIEDPGLALVQPSTTPIRDGRGPDSVGAAVSDGEGVAAWVRVIKREIARKEQSHDVSRSIQRGFRCFLWNYEANGSGYTVQGLDGFLQGGTKCYVRIKFNYFYFFILGIY